MVFPQATRIVFMGTARFAVPSLEALVREGYGVVAVFTQPPRPAGRGRRLTAPPVLMAAERLGLSVQTPERVRAPEVVKSMAELKPDLIVVAAYAQILPKALLDVPRKGCVNVHASLLPRWRGASPIQAAILAGDEITGVTIILMEPGLDTGPILSQRETRIEEQDTAATLEERLSHLGAELLVSTLPPYLDGTLRPVPQDESRATYAPIIKKEAGLIEWSRPAREIWRANRAYTPWPGTYTYWKGKMLKVVSCWPEEGATAGEPPGTVVPLDGSRGAGVVTGGGTLRLLEVALEGSRPMGIREFLLGHRDFIGSRVG
ncbi:MAG: methionyl-tRNA formyltransferase [Sphingomonadaceae bacterium]